MNDHPFCTWIYRRHPAEYATIRRCFCGAEERVTPRPVTVTVTVRDLPRELTARREVAA